MTFLAKRPDQGIFAGFDDDPVMVAGVDDEPVFVGESEAGTGSAIGSGLQLIGALSLGFFAVRAFMKGKAHHHKRSQRRAARRAYGFRS